MIRAASSLPLAALIALELAPPCAAATMVDSTSASVSRPTAPRIDGSYRNHLRNSPATCFQQSIGPRRENSSGQFVC